MEMFESRLTCLFGCIAIFMLAIVGCLSSLNGDFVFDDTEAILNNRDVLPSTPVWNIFKNDFWGTALTHNNSHKSYRPLTVLSFRVNYLMSDGLTPRNFHAVNIFLHGFVSILTWPVFEKVLGYGRRITAFMGSLLFAVHPIHTEAVCGIVGRADLLSALFFFCSFLAFSHSCASNVLGWIWLSASLICAGVSMFCKEQGITVIGFNCVYDLIVKKGLTLRIVIQTIRQVLDRRKKFTWNPEWLMLVVLVLTGASMIWFRYYLMNFESPTFQPLDNPASHAEDLFTRVLSYSYIFSLNAWLILCPVWLCFDWSMGCIPLTTIQDARVAAVVLFWLCLCFVIWKGCKMQNSCRQRDLLLSLAMIVVPFLPASNVLFSVGFVIAERVLYIPSAGVCLLVVCGVELLCRRYPLNRNDVMFGYSLLLLVLLLRSHDRSRQWKTEFALFNSGLEVCPDNAKVHYNVAKNAADLGDVKRAVAEYREALRLYPEYEQALNNLANILKHSGELSEAETLLRRAVKLRNNFPAAWMNLGIVLATRKQYLDAEKSYMNALKYRKHYPDCFYNLGNMYQEQKQYTLAERAWKTATHLNPRMSVAWNNLIILYDNLGRLNEAVEAGREAVTITPDEPSLHFNLANALGKMAAFEDSEKHFTAAIARSQSNALYYVNQGVLYHRWGKLTKAEESYRKALQLSPKLKSARDNYDMLKKQLAGKVSYLVW